MNPHNVHEALKNLVEYNWDKEYEDYHENGETEGHIFKSLQILTKHLSEDGLKVVVFKGIPEVFNDMTDAEEYAEEQTRESLNPHTILIVNENTLNHALTAEYMGVRLGSTATYRENHCKD